MPDTSDTSFDPTQHQVTDPGLTDAQRAAIIRACEAAGGHFVSRDPSFPRQFGRCLRCDTFVGD